MLPSRRPASSAGPPSELGRAAVSAALAVYLLGLVVSIAGNSGSGTSALVRTIKGRLFSPWMVPPWLDLGFDYRLTYGGPEDGGHEFEIRPFADRKAAVLLPGPRTGERASRWRRLARAAVPTQADGERAGLVAAAVGQGMFADLESDDVVVRVLRTPLADRAAEAGPTTAVSTSRVRMVGGDLQLLRSEPAGEVAPLVRPTKDGAGEGPR